MPTRTDFSFFDGRRVLVTGHTGFKGSWLAEWLLALGSDVVGIALPPETSPSLYLQLQLDERLSSHFQDIRDLAALRKIVSDFQPEMLFHLAAQPLVRRSYDEPILTFETNALGTAHILESLRALDGPCHAVIVTTDKVYESRESGGPYVEDDRLGGHDPYSSSKASAELIAASYRRSFFPPARFGLSHSIGVATARAGNVIGGGDWAEDRLVPDIVRGLERGQVVDIRHPLAIRPWQHVLEPLSGYLALAYAMAHAATLEERSRIFGSFNFGPSAESVRTVSEVVKEVLATWPGDWRESGRDDAKKEASYLALDIEHARDVLGWTPTWGFVEAVSQTVKWYRTVMAEPGRARELTSAQISEFQRLKEEA